MALDVYRGCSRVEKRQVLERFWRRDVVASERITTAAVQYGPWAVVCCAVLALEPVPVLVLSVGRSPALAWSAAVVEAVVVLSLWWAVRRCVALRREPLP